MASQHVVYFPTVNARTNTFKLCKTIYHQIIIIIHLKNPELRLSPSPFVTRERSNVRQQINNRNKIMERVLVIIRALTTTTIKKMRIAIFVPMQRAKQTLENQKLMKLLCTESKFQPLLQARESAHRASPLSDNPQLYIKCSHCM